MSIQLKLNNSGAWKTIPHDIDPDDLEAVRAAVLELLACDRHAGGRTTARMKTTARWRTSSRRQRVIARCACRWMRARRTTQS